MDLIVFIFNNKIINLQYKKIHNKIIWNIKELK